jgi:K+-sensing histidine kinase KdpD
VQERNSIAHNELRRVEAKPSWDWIGFAWAVATVGLATAIGWPLVHSKLQFHNVNVLMLYLLSVLWVATHHSRGAAILASALGVAVFDFAFVEPYYTFAVADRQYIVTFAVMLLTALVISTLTHRMRLQAELARQAWERVEAEFLRNTLLSGVSHELRTPLAAITGAASTLIETDNALNKETRQDLLETIYSESERMERLINNLLDMTRMESGGMVLKREWLPVQELVGSAIRRHDRRLKGREVKSNLPADLPLIHADGVLIEQVLSNLIDNAIEYTPQGSSIEVGASVSDHKIAIEVADRGPGLPPGTENRVFEKFFRIRPTETRRGIGLGLAIVRGIVEAHGGQITAANRSGGGASFRFTLPLDDIPPSMDSSE